MSKLETKTNNTPTLRFPEFSGEWEEKRLGEIFIERTERMDISKFEMLSVSLSQGVTKQDTSKKRDNSSADKRNYKVVRKGDIAYNTMRMWQGASGLSDLEGIVSPAYTVVYPSKGNPKFFSYYFKFPRLVFNFYRYSKGLTSDTWNLKYKHFSEIECTVPERVEEQRKIASFLTSIDDWIENLKKQKEAQEKYKKGMMQKILSHELRFKDENGNDYPEWEEKRLWEIADFWNGKAHEQDISAKGDFIVVNSKFVSTEGRIRKFSNRQISPLIKDDIVMVMSDIPNGKAIAKCFLIDENNHYTLNQRIGGIRGKYVENRFLIRILNRNHFLLRHDNGVSQTNLRKEEILRCPLWIPIIFEQRKIADFLSSIDDLINLTNKRITLAEKWKKGLMQRVFI